jgi:hypothetical protein
MNLDMLIAWIAPMVLIGGIIWRASSKLANLETAVKSLERDNSDLRAELRAIERLIKLMLDRNS